MPIIALTATCPPKVLDDLLKVLKMAPTTDSRTADSSGTVLFTCAAPFTNALTLQGAALPPEPALCAEVARAHS